MDEHTLNTVVIPEIVRRRKMLNVVVTALIETLRSKRRKRSVWSREWLLRREAGRGVLTMLFQELSPEDPVSFKNFTRMSGEVFNELLLCVSPLILKKDTAMREAISPQNRLSATLRYLVTGNTFQDLSYALRIAPNTLSQIVVSTCKSIVQVLEERVIAFPTTPEQWERISDRYANNWQFPNCIGALDGKHIEFRPPRKDGSLYRNYKGSDSIVLMALVNADYRFIFVDIGRNGRMHDSTVFRTSALGSKLESGSLNLPAPKELPGYAYPMPYVIVADDAFMLKTNLMKPYPDRNLDLEKRVFNYRLSRARRMSENAFGIMANRFRVLLNPIPLAVEKVELITYTCVLLHNFLLSKNCHQWYVPSNCRGGNPESMSAPLQGLTRQGGNRSSLPAQEICDKFCDYFNTAGIVNWQYDAVEKGNM